MLFEVKILFLYKNSETVEVKCKDSFTAIKKALDTLDSTEKDNVSAVLITDVKE